MTIPFGVPVTRRRYAPGSAGADGRRTRGAAVDAAIVASMQPVKGEQLVRLSEGLRKRVTLVAYTEDDLRTADQAGKVFADEVIYQGATYVVDHVATWTELLPHVEAYLTRLGEAGGNP